MIGPAVAAPVPPSSTKTTTARSPWIAIIEPLIVAFILVAVIELAVALQNWGQTCPPGTQRVSPHWTAIQCGYDRSPGAP